jgi:hypothetical protein
MPRFGNAANVDPVLALLHDPWVLAGGVTMLALATIAGAVASYYGWKLHRKALNSR